MESPGPKYLVSCRQVCHSKCPRFWHSTSKGYEDWSRRFQVRAIMMLSLEGGGRSKVHGFTSVINGSLPSISRAKAAKARKCQWDTSGWFSLGNLTSQAPLVRHNPTERLADKRKSTSDTSGQRQNMQLSQVTSSRPRY